MCDSKILTEEDKEALLDPFLCLFLSIAEQKINFL